MSCRRHVGDLVRVNANCGFVGGGPYLCEIRPGDPEDWFCDCGDTECGEWPNLFIVDEVVERRRRQGSDESRQYLGMLCHVRECEMADAGGCVDVPES